MMHPLRTNTKYLKWRLDIYQKFNLEQLRENDRPWLDRWIVHASRSIVLGHMLDELY
jgi:hypothetical protein